MEKISLKPIARELLFKTDGSNAFFDVASYSGSNVREKALGSLYLISHIASEREDLGYVTNLLSSLAKREYYSENAIKNKDSRKAFEGTLQKLNEVLKDFFANKDFELHIGLAAIAGDKILISRLGKFKVGLARNGEYIDVLNNVNLFHKSPEHEQQFSNVISGILYPGDRIFAYYPSKSITSRERAIRASLLKEDQPGFGQKLASFADASQNFNCCGIHVKIDQIKEIPLESLPSRTILASSQPMPDDDEEDEVEDEIDQPVKTPEEAPKEIQAKPKVIAAELSLAKRKSVFSVIGRGVSSLGAFQRLSPRRRMRNFSIIAVVIIAPVVLFVVLRENGNSGSQAAYRSAAESMKQSEIKVREHDMRTARLILQSTLAQLSAFSDKKIDVLKGQISASLDGMDKTSSVQPTFVHAFVSMEDNATLRHLALMREVPVVMASDGSLIQFADNIETKLETVKPGLPFMFGGESLAVYNGNDHIAVYSPSSKRTATYSFKDSVATTIAALYEGNLYTIANNLINKYAEAAVGNSTRSTWNKDELVGNPLSIAVDGNVFVLTKEGKLAQYFLGKKKGEFDLGIAPSEKSRIFTTTDGRDIYLLNPESRRLYEFKKESGELVTSYKLDTLGELLSATVAQDGTLWLLSSGNKLWTIKP